MVHQNGYIMTLVNIFAHANILKDYAASGEELNPKKIKQAIVILGLQESKRFVSLLFTAHLCASKPQVLMSMSLTRARFCELMVKNIAPPQTQSSAFLIGLLSLIDAMLDADIYELMEKLPISQTMKDAITNRKGVSANLLTLCELYECGDWQKIDQYCQQIHIKPNQSSAIFQQAIDWTNERANIVN